MPLMSPFPQNPKFQEPVTLDFLDAELENDIKVEVRRRGEVLLIAPHAVVSVLGEDFECHHLQL